MITIKEEFLSCDKLARALAVAGSDALAMWLAMKGHASANLTDGFVADEDIAHLPGAPARNQERALRALLECGRMGPDGSRGQGLVERLPHGWQLHDYLEHADSAAIIRERRRVAAEKKARQRAVNKPETCPAGGLSLGDTPACPSGTTTETVTGTDQGCPEDALARAPAPSPPQPSPDPEPPTVPQGTSEPGPGKTPRRRRPRREPETPIPAVVKTTPEHIARAAASGVDMATEMAKFRAHADAHDRRCARWGAAFTQWLIQAGERGQQSGGRPSLARSAPAGQAQVGLKFEVQT